MKATAATMKKVIFWLYTGIRVLWIPLVVAVPMITIQRRGTSGFTVTFPAITLVPLFLLLEVLMNRRYRKDFSLLSAKYWVVTGLIGWVLTAIILLLGLPSLPLRNDQIVNPVGFVVTMIIAASVLVLFMTIPAIIARKRTVGLFKKSELFK